MAKQILSVSYDEALLRTRELLLRREGYGVISALGFAEAVEQCQNGSFDLFILGHSIPNRDKRELVSRFRARSNAPVLGLRRHGEDPLDDARYHAYPDDIEGLLKTVSTILK